MLEKRKKRTSKDGKTEKEDKGSVKFICRIIITIVQIRKSAYSTLSSTPRAQSCMVYCSAEFPVIGAFHVESVHKTHSYGLYVCDMWLCNMWINYCKFQGIFPASQSNQLYYEICSLCNYQIVKKGMYR